MKTLATIFSLTFGMAAFAQNGLAKPTGVSTTTKVENSEFNSSRSNKEQRYAPETPPGSTPAPPPPAPEKSVPDSTKTVIPPKPAATAPPRNN